MKLVDNKATLSFSNGSPSVDLPMYAGTVGPDVIDIRKLYAQTGMFTYDPGFLSTASCQSAIRANCFIGATRSSNWPHDATTWKPATCCSTASCRMRRSARPFTRW